MPWPTEKISETLAREGWEVSNRASVALWVHTATGWYVRRLGTQRRRALPSLPHVYLFVSRDGKRAFMHPTGRPFYTLGEAQIAAEERMKRPPAGGYKLSLPYSAQARSEA